MHARLFITGTPRSGTRYIAAVLRSAGLRVGHEEHKRDGLVSSIHAVDDFMYVNKRTPPRRAEMAFDHIWMQTRDPRAAIPSIAKALPVNFWRWQEKHTGVPGDGEPALLRAMSFWCAWIPLAQAQKPEWTYKLENFERVWPEMRSRLNLVDTDSPAIDPARYKSGAERVSWDDMIAVHPTMGRMVKKLAGELGYD